MTCLRDNGLNFCYSLERYVHIKYKKPGWLKFVYKSFIHLIEISHFYIFILLVKQIKFFWITRLGAFLSDRY